MESVSQKFFGNLINNYRAIQGKKMNQQRLIPSYEESDPADMKIYLEESMHHYLPKKTPQTRIKFYQINGQTFNIEDEQFFAAEHLTQNDLDQFQVQDKKPSKNGRFDQQLLTYDIQNLLIAIENKKAQEAATKEAIQKEQMDRALDEFYMTDDDQLQQVPAPKLPTQLWVDKYTSMKYFDLLTDEVTNRNVLTWLKTWDELVFPSNPKVSLRIPDSLMNKPNHSGSTVNLNQMNNLSFMQQQQETFSYKNKRVLLLYGPPGTGKSTMARLLARHCGYESQEINASDERTGTKILDKIKTAISSNDYFTLQKHKNVPQNQAKPVCLIVDEVDGALGSSLDGSKGIGQIVQFLKKCINYQVSNSKSKLDLDEGMHESEEEDNNEGAVPFEESKVQQKRKKKDTDVVPLVRPIIFICNDMYAKALMPLREIALAIKIGESNPGKLIQRLRYICKEEKVSIEDQIIKELAEETNFDARSCINTLQFMASAQKESGQRITIESTVQAAGSFQCFKDTVDSVFNVADSMMLNKDQSHSFNNSRMLNQVKTKVQQFGDVDLLNDFMFHNYGSSIAYFDDDLEKTALYLDLLSRNDNINKYIHRTQNYELLSSQYLPCYAFKRYCAGQRAIGKKNEYPRELRNISFEQKKYEGIFESLLDVKGIKKQFKKINIAGRESTTEDEERYKLNQHSSIITSMKRTDFQKDVLPYVFYMIHPSVREINTQLFTKHEKMNFQTAIEVMVMFDIKLNAESVNRDIDSQIASFEPDISSLVTFAGGRKEFMRNKTQIMILQNYEQVKQRMLTNSSINLFSVPLIKNKQQALQDAKLSGYGFLAGFAQKSMQQEANKKRKLGEISNESASSTAKFTYKFKEGHSKNFKRELTFDYFVA